MLCLISAVMIYQETLVIRTLDQSGDLNVPGLAGASGMLLIYLVPLFFLGVFMIKKEKISVFYFMTAFISGGFVIGSLSGLVNYHLTDILVKIIPFKEVTENWMPSVVPPLTEELLKLTIALLVIYAGNCRTLRSWMAVGLASGLGFQFLEDYTYILGSVIEGEITPFTQSLLRIESAYATHWLLTALSAGACFILICQKDMRKKVISYVLLLSPWALHVLWNSPYIDHNMVLKTVLSFSGWILILWMYLYFEKTDKSKQFF